MPTFVMLTQISADAVGTPQNLESLEKETMKHIRSECPEVEWVKSYSLLGPYDYLDIFNAPDVDSATKVGMLIRSYGHAHSEIFAATEWGKFKELIHGMPHAA